MQGSRRDPRAARRSSHVRSALSTAIVAALLFAGNASAQSQDPGRVGNPDSWKTNEFNADWGLQAINAHYAYARGLTGRGIRLGVFDTGVDLRHGEFAGKGHRGIRIADVLKDGSLCTNTVALAGPDACFMSDGDTVALEYFEYTDEDRALVQYLVEQGYLYDWVPEYLESIAGFSYQSHGTHVAGTMAANRDGEGMHGVAFGADFTSARLFSNSYYDLFSLLGWGGESYANGPDSSAVASMYAQMAAQGVRAINHSWGLAQEPTSVQEMDELYALPGVAEYFATYADPSLQHGMLQVWAAGNNYGEIAGIYATLPRWIEGLEQYWLSVVNLAPNGQLDDSSSICGQTKDWCVTAPGTDITSSIVDGEVSGRVVRDADGNFVGLEIDEENPEYGYADYTGTSMAAPHVTGALALLMERFPYLNNPQIRDVLLTTATDIGEEGVDEIYGWGLIDLRRAIEGPGQIRVDTEVVMNQRAGGAKVWEGLAWDDWTNDIGGDGRLTKSGIGWLRLSGDNTFGGLTVKQGVLELDGDNALGGDVRVQGGFLLLDGGLHNTLQVDSGQAIVNGLQTGLTTIGAGGKLSGAGTLANTTVAGTVAPGNSIGTLTINGNYVQTASGVYEAELAANGSADLLRVTGSAALDGTLRLFASAGQYRLGQSYTLLTAGGGVSGRFATVDSSAFSPFLRFLPDYRTSAFGLSVVRGMALADAARTPNQRAVGAAADRAADSDPVLQSLAQLFPAQALPAFDALSGEVHASAQAALIADSRHLRDAALARAQAGEGTFDAAAEGEAQGTAWVELLRTGGKLDADGNAARLDHDGDATLVGYDYRFANGWRIGAFGGVGDARLDVRDRASEAEVDSRHLGVYAAQNWGGLGVRAGIVQSRHELDIERTVAFPGITAQTRARYDADALQGFAEAGYRFGAQAWEVQPFVQYAHVRLDTDGFRESGGAAALTGRGEEERRDVATAGLRFALNLKGARQEESWLSLRGMVGRRHIGGDGAPASTVMWTGGSAFDVRGTPLADEATVLEAGLAARLGRDGLLELGYSGQHGDQARDHGLNARLSWKF